jgi:armadillo repeat-containing protein 1
MYPSDVRDKASGVVCKIAPRKEPATAPATTAAVAALHMAAVGTTTTTSSSSSTPAADATSSSSSSSFFRGNLNKNARTLTLHVAGLDDAARRKLAEDQLLAVKGVVSFTFDMAASRVVVRARNEVAPETLCAALSATKVLAAAQVVRDEQGHEVVLTFGKVPPGTGAGAGAGAAAAAVMPKYLDDEDAAGETGNTKQSLARPGDAAGLSGWLSKGLGYLSKSLYW